MGVGGLHQNTLEIDFIVVSDRGVEGSDIYQLLLIPWKKFVPSRNYRLSKVSAYVQMQLYCASVS